MLVNIILFLLLIAVFISLLPFIFSVLFFLLQLAIVGAVIYGLVLVVKEILAR